jgi:hypothetical protein
MRPPDNHALERTGPGETVLVIRKTVERPAGRSMLIRYPALSDPA